MAIIGRSEHSPTFTLEKITTRWLPDWTNVMYEILKAVAIWCSQEGNNAQKAEEYRKALNDVRIAINRLLQFM